MPSTRPPAHAELALRRGPAILTVAALVVLLVAALGAVGVISVPTAAGSSGPSATGSAVERSVSTASIASTPAATPGASSTPAATTSAGVTTSTAPSSSAGSSTPATQAPGSTQADTETAATDGFALAIGSFFDALAEPAEDSPTSTPVTPTSPSSSSAIPSTPSTDSTALPANSGTGKRIVYAITAQRVWLVEADGTVSRTYRVSGRLDEPGPGTYAVYSRSPTAVSYDYKEHMKYMVRFTHGANAAIGFHDIPVDQSGKPVETVQQLGQPLSAGCIRQSEDDAIALWNWAPVGTKVVVVA